MLFTFPSIIGSKVVQACSQVGAVGVAGRGDFKRLALQGVALGALLVVGAFELCPKVGDGLIRRHFEVA
jgi:hypothetical protein